MGVLPHDPVVPGFNTYRTGVARSAGTCTEWPDGERQHRSRGPCSSGAGRHVASNRTNRDPKIVKRSTDLSGCPANLSSQPQQTEARKRCLFGFETEWQKPVPPPVHERIRHGCPVLGSGALRTSAALRPNENRVAPVYSGGTWVPRTGVGCPRSHPEGRYRRFDRE